jgi:pimeloyl-ACP methyl ester carboxylesterase
MTKILFLHGIGAGADSYLRLHPLVPDSEALNLPGFGEEPADPPLSFPKLADWCAAKIDAEAGGEAILFGHSFGGMLALETALTHPGKVRALVLCGATPAFGGRDPSFAEQFLEGRLGPLDRGATMEDLARESAVSMVAPDTPDEVIRLFADGMAHTPEAVYRDVVRCLTTFDRRDDLGKVTQPALCLAGTHDKAAPAKTVAKMAERLPKGAYRELDVGHLIPLEAPEAVAADLAAFRARLEETP